MKVLSIGNSFSQDAHHYLHQIAKKDNVKINVFNLFIGGCSFSTHYRNLLSDNSEYILELNGVSTGFKVSIKQALLSQEWDVITLQQASHLSINYDTFEPYASEINTVIRNFCPKAKVLIHETWAYEDGCERLAKLGYTNSKDMYNALKISYEKLKSDISADGIIPSGTLLNALNGKVGKLHRDTFHASLGIGRYALGVLWYKVLTGKSVINNSFDDFDTEIVEEDIRIIKECVENMI